MILSPDGRKSRQPLAKASHAFSHHALLYAGAYDECLSRIPLSERTGIDAEILIRESLDIAEARALRERASSRPIQDKKRRFIIAVAHIPHEAQNALLKLFEDPPATAQFYLIIPRAELLLPTLRSRLHLAYEEDGSQNAPASRTVAFLTGTNAGRLEQIAKLVKTKDTPTMRALIRGIEYAAAERIGEKSIQQCLPDILMASSYSETRGASHKMLLEHLALSIPEKLSA